MKSQFQRLGTYFAGTNCDGIETCPYPGMEHIFVSFHYELLSRQDQCKVGQMYLGSINLSHDIVPLVPLPSNEYCGRTSDDNETLPLLTTDISQRISSKLPTFAHTSPESQQNALGPCLPSNVSIKFLDTLFSPPIFDLKWAPYRFYEPSVLSQSPLVIASSLLSSTSRPRHLLAGAMGDGTLRLYALEHTDTSSYAGTPLPSSHTSTMLQCLAVLPISSTASCVSISWSGHPSYDYNSNDNVTSSSSSSPWLSIQQSLYTRHIIDNIVDAQFPGYTLSLSSSSSSSSSSSANDLPLGWSTEYPLGWSTEYSLGWSTEYSHTADTTTSCDGNDDYAAYFSPINIPPLSQWTEVTDINAARDIRSKQQQGRGNLCEPHLYDKTKTSSSIYISVGLSDGTIAIVDVIPVLASSSSSSSPEKEQEQDNTIDNTTIAQPVWNYTLKLTHHFKASESEIWMTCCDSYDHNIIYSGSDDTYMRKWYIPNISPLNMIYIDTLYLSNYYDNDTNDNYDDDTCNIISRFFMIPHNSTTTTSESHILYDLVRTSYTQSHGHAAIASYMPIPNEKYGDGTNSKLSTLSAYYITPDILNKSQFSLDLVSFHNTYTDQSNLSCSTHPSGLRFNTEYTPQKEYPALLNKSHEGGVVEIRCHPLNSRLLLTGSYDNHLSIFDKNNLSTPISRIDTGGGAWRIKFHPYPLLSHHFLLVNMYHGAQICSIQGLTLPHNNNDHYQLCDIDTFSSNHHPLLDCPTDINTIKSLWSQIESFDDITLTVSNSDSSTTTLNTPGHYTEHGNTTIVYGGDWVHTPSFTTGLIIDNQTSPRVYSSVPSIVLTGSFYNRRIDVSLLVQKYE